MHISHIKSFQPIPSSKDVSNMLFWAEKQTYFFGESQDICKNLFLKVWQENGLIKNHQKSKLKPTS